VSAVNTCVSNVTDLGTLEWDMFFSPFLTLVSITQKLDWKTNVLAIDTWKFEVMFLKQVTFCLQCQSFFILENWKCECDSVKRVRRGINDWMCYCER
jgi:hypothetical protein